MSDGMDQLHEKLARHIALRHPNKIIRVFSAEVGCIKIEVEGWLQTELSIKPPRGCCAGHRHEDIVAASMELEYVLLELDLIPEQDWRDE